MSNFATIYDRRNSIGTIKGICTSGWCHPGFGVDCQLCPYRLQPSILSWQSSRIGNTVYCRLATFRVYALGGLISFRRGFAFSCYTFFYASLAFALVQYLYFTFLDNGRMEDMLDNTIRVMTPIYKEQGISPKELNAAAEVITSLSPIYIAITFMMQNLFIGLLLSLPVALLGRRSKPRL